MATSYTSLLGLALPVTGELQGTWGDVVNDYITSYIDASVAGTQTISGSQTAVTLSVTNGSSLTTVGSGATGSAQFQIINCTGNPGGLLTITAPASSRQYIIINATSTNQSVKIVGSGPTTGVTLVAGEKAHVAWNGSDFVKIATQSGNGDFVTVDTTNLEVTNIKAKDGTAALSIADSTGAVTVATALTANGGAVFNENGANVDFRVEGDTDANLLFVDASADSVGIGTNTPAARLHIRVTGGTDDTLLSFGANQDNFITAGSSGVTIFRNLGTERLRITSGGQVNIGGNFTSTNNTLQVTGNAAIGYTTAAPTTGLIVAGNVGVGTDAPTRKVSISGSSSAVMDFYATSYKRFAIGSDSRGFVIYDDSASVYRMEIDSSGNLGLGVTPSAWGMSGANKAFQNLGGSLYSVNTQNLGLAQNSYYNGTNNIYVTTSAATSYFQSNGSHIWYNAPSGTAGNAITFTQAMTLDASGNLLVGDTSTNDNATLFVRRANATNGALTYTLGWFQNATGYKNGLAIKATDNAVTIAADFAGSAGGAAALVFATNSTSTANNATERARITSGGYFKASNSGTYLDSTGSFHELASDDVDDAVAVLKLTNASYTGPGAFVDISRNTTNNTFYAISYYNRGASAYKFRVADSGAIATAGGIALGTATPATSGIGVQFPATQSASSDANTLDDYEEGTWTPAWSVSGGTITAGSNTSGNYVKIGRVVYIWGYISYGSHTGSPTGALSITGLPFTASQQYGQQNLAGFFVHWNAFWVSNPPLAGNTVTGATTTIALMRSGTTGQVNVDFSDMDTGAQNYSQVGFFGQYQI